MMFMRHGKEIARPPLSYLQNAGACSDSPQKDQENSAGQ